MKLNSISGIVCYVKDLSLTAEFYKAIGMRVDEREAGKLTAYVNWFWIDFHQSDQEDKAEFKQEATAETKGAGQYLYIKVNDVDAAHQEFVGKGLKPSSEPRDWPWGNREFVMRDPDGYKLVFFNKTK